MKSSARLVGRSLIMCQNIVVLLIYDRKTKSISYGKIPPYSVVVAGSMPSDNDKDGPNLYCAVIVKTVDEKTRSKTSVNDLLRE